MDVYKSDRVGINCDINTVFAKLSTPSVFKEFLEQHKDTLPPEARDNLSKLHFENDSITVVTPMGPIKLAVDEAVEPEKVVFKATQSPVPFGLQVNLEPDGEQATSAVAEIHLDLPFFLRSMVGGQLADGAKKFGQVLAALPYGNL